MDDIYEFNELLPLKPQGQSVEYIRHHFSALEQCLVNGLYSSAFLHMHILYMTFVYYQLLRIAQSNKTKFKKSLMFLDERAKKPLLEIIREKDGNSNPFLFFQVLEKSVFRFFQLEDFYEQLIGKIAECVNLRNDISQANGQIYMNQEEVFIDELKKYVKNMYEIISAEDILLRRIHKMVLDKNRDEWSTSGVIDTDDIELNFIIPYYISAYEIEKVINWNLEDSLSLSLEATFRV